MLSWKPRKTWDRTFQIVTQRAVKAQPNSNEISRRKSTLMLKYISPLSGKVPVGFKKSRPVRKEPSKIR